MSLRETILLILGGLLLAGCSGPPADNPLLRSVRGAYTAASADTAWVLLASDQFERARYMIEEAEEAHQSGQPEELIAHFAWLAQRQLDVAHQQAHLALLRDATTVTVYDLREIRLVAREEAALVAETRARLEQQRAEEARQEADAAIARANQIGPRVTGLEAELTSRGLAVTLEDFFFEDGQATLRPGAEQALTGIISLLNEYPTRRVLIEGHSDPGNSPEETARLSQQRAETIRSLLIRRGISPDRITAVGLGARFPIMNNETPANRRINRRVEIIISDADGTITPRSGGNSSPLR